MTRLFPVAALSVAVLVAFAALALAPVASSASAQDTVVVLEAPDDVDYWVCEETGARVHWGAAGIVIDEWDTHDHGFDHDGLVWYRYRYIYPDGRTYRTGYDYVVRAHPDPCIRPGTWSCHNWPCNSPDALVEFRVTPVRVNPVPPPPRPDYGGGSPPYYSPPHTTVTVNTRWYPPPPTVRYSTSYSYRYRSRWAFYAGWSWGTGWHYHHPYHSSRYALATAGLVVGTIVWAHLWDRYQQQNAYNNFQSRMLREQFRQTLEAPEVPKVEYISELHRRLQGVERYTGSPVDHASTDVLTDAEAIFAAENWPTPGQAEDEASRVPARFFDRMPMPKLDTVGNEKAPGEVMAAMTADMLPLTKDAAIEPVENVALIDQALGLWSGQQPRVPRTGPFAGQSRALVSETLLEPADEETADEIRVIENAAEAFDELTEFVRLSEEGEMSLAGASGDDRPVFALASNGAELASFVPRRDYEKNPDPVDVMTLVPAEEEDPLVRVSTEPLERTVNFHRIEWRPLPERYRELTGADDRGALLPPPALRGNAREVWESFFIARSRDK